MKKALMNAMLLMVILSLTACAKLQSNVIKTAREQRMRRAKLSEQEGEKGIAK